MRPVLVTGENADAGGREFQVFRVIVSPAKQRRWPIYLVAAIVIIFVAKYPVAAAHVASKIGVLAGEVARDLSVFVSHVHLG